MKLLTFLLRHLVMLAISLHALVAAGEDSPTLDELRAAAAKGDPEAHYSIGKAYYQGAGLPKDSRGGPPWKCEGTHRFGRDVQ